MRNKSKKVNEIVYSRDASRIEGNLKEVFFPKNEAEVRKIVKEYANIVPRGGGTGLAGGAVPRDSVVLDMSKMNKILDIDVIGKTAEVEAGVICEELSEILEKYHLEFPVKPSSSAVCTIGGMLATNASGIRAVKYGSMLDWTKEIEIIDGNGEFRKLGLTDIGDVIGMEGITGIILKAKLKLIEKKERTASLLKIEDIGRVVEWLRKLKVMPDVSMIEFLDKLTSQAIGLEKEYHLLVEFESERGSHKQEAYKQLVSLREKIYPSLASLGFIHIEDPKIFLAKFPEFSTWLEEHKIPYFSHIGIGIVHPVFKDKQDSLIEDMTMLVKKLGGKISGEHGIGIKKRKFLEENDKKIIRAVKNRYDPSGKLNPGKVI